MKNTYETYLKKQLENPVFRKAWKETELEYHIAQLVINRRLQKSLSQRDLAKKLRTSQAVITRIEGMSANPTLKMLKKIARALDKKLEVNFV